MACSLSSFCNLNQVLSRHKKIFDYRKIRSQSFRDNELSFCLMVEKGGPQLQRAVTLRLAVLASDLHKEEWLELLQHGSDGKPENIVDANLNVLRERIQRVRKRERLIDTCGWNYKHNYEDKVKRSSDYALILSECVEIMGIACGTIGLVFLFGSLGICLVSLLLLI